MPHTIGETHSSLTSDLRLHLEMKRKPFSCLLLWQRTTQNLVSGRHSIIFCASLADACPASLCKHNVLTVFKIFWKNKQKQTHLQACCDSSQQAHKCAAHPLTIRRKGAERNKQTNKQTNIQTDKKDRTFRMSNQRSNKQTNKQLEAAKDHSVPRSLRGCQRHVCIIGQTFRIRLQVHLRCNVHDRRRNCT